MPNFRIANQAQMILSRSREQLEELDAFAKRRRPFKYLYEIDAASGDRTIFPERDEDEIDIISRRCSEVIASFRTSIEYAYRAVVEPCVDEARFRNIQFPASQKEEELINLSKKRLAFEVGQDFVDEILQLRPHGGRGGDADLFFICSMDNDAKHGRIVPMGYYANLKISKLRRIIPDFPSMFSDDSELTVGNNGEADVRWHGPKMNINERIINKVPIDGKLRREINVPVKIAFEGETTNNRTHAIESLSDLYLTAEKAVAALLKHRQT